MVGELPKTHSDNHYFDNGGLWIKVPGGHTHAESGCTDDIKLFIKFFTTCGIVEEVLTDNRTNFISVTVTELFYSLGVKHHMSAPYHLQTNGM